MVFIQDQQKQEEEIEPEAAIEEEVDELKMLDRKYGYVDRFQ